MLLIRFWPSIGTIFDFLERTSGAGSHFLRTRFSRHPSAGRRYQASCAVNPPCCRCVGLPLLCTETSYIFSLNLRPTQSPLEINRFHPHHSARSARSGRDFWHEQKSPDFRDRFRFVNDLRFVLHTVNGNNLATNGTRATKGATKFTFLETVLFIDRLL